MDLEGGMPFFFQQFGANIDGFKHALEAFKLAGAKDVIGQMNNPGRIQAAYQHDAGVPVTAFEVGSVDRSKSRTEQGFQNLVDSIIENFHTRQFARFLDKLSVVQEPNGKTLLDNTMALLGSGMGNASSHSNKDLPLL